MNPKVSVIIPFFKRKDVLEKCLESLSVQKFTDFDVIVADNQGSLELPNVHGLAVRIERMPENLYFSEAVNRAISETEADYILVLNSDVLLDNEYLSSMMDYFASSPGADCASGVLYTVSGNIDTCGLAHGLSLRPRDLKSIPGGVVPGPSGAAFMITRRLAGSLVRKYGFVMDPDISFYYSDLDLCFRLMEMNIVTHFIPSASGIHLRGSSVDSHRSFFPFMYAGLDVFYKKLLIRNRRAFLKKWKKYAGFPRIMFVHGYSILLNLFLLADIIKSRVFRRDEKESLIVRGIKTRSRAFTGPETVELDITDFCSNKCIGCWTHSPLIKPSAKQALHMLDYKTILNLLAELKNTGVQKIHLAGAGEPLMHPDIPDIIRDIKSRGFSLLLNTSLYPIPAGLENLLVETGTDYLTCSVWAGSAEEWTITHPGADITAFLKISEFLKKIHLLKTSLNLEKPRIKIYNVITSVNYKNIEQMLDFSLMHHADELEFQAADIVPGATEHLRLNQEQAESVLEQLENLRKRNDYTSEFIGPGSISEEQKEFGRFFHVFKEGFLRKNGQTVICPMGHKNIRRSWIHDMPYPEFSYEWDSRICSVCSRSARCYPAPESVPLTAGFTNLLGAGSFSRRIRTPGAMDTGILRSLPCTVAWHYSRIKADGSVIPCCKATNFPVGSIKTEKFSSIWFGDKMNEFRQKSVLRSQNQHFFSKISCFQGCDNLGKNIEYAQKSGIENA